MLSGSYINCRVDWVAHQYSIWKWTFTLSGWTLNIENSKTECRSMTLWLLVSDSMIIGWISYMKWIFFNTILFCFRAFSFSFFNSAVLFRQIAFYNIQTNHVKKVFCLHFTVSTHTLITDMTHMWQEFARPCHQFNVHSW